MKAGQEFFVSVTLKEWPCQVTGRRKQRLRTVTCLKQVGAQKTARDSAADSLRNIGYPSAKGNGHVLSNYQLTHVQQVAGRAKLL